MKWFDKVTKKFAKSATSAVKEEVKEVALDLLPAVLTIGGIALGVALYSSHTARTNALSNVDSVGGVPLLPSHSDITITTNNYYGNDLIQKLIDGEE